MVMIQEFALAPGQGQGQQAGEPEGRDEERGVIQGFRAWAKDSGGYRRGGLDGDSGHNGRTVVEVHGPGWLAGWAAEGKEAGGGGRQATARNLHRCGELADGGDRDGVSHGTALGHGQGG